jgi:hypothetical protein
MTNVRVNGSVLAHSTVGRHHPFWKKQFFVEGLIFGRKALASELNVVNSLLLSAYDSVKSKDGCLVENTMERYL